MKPETHRNIFPNAPPHLIPAAILTASTAVATVIACVQVLLIEHKHVRELTDQEAHKYQIHLEDELRERVKALDRMAGRWARRPGPMPYQEWEQDVKAYLKDLENFRAIQYVSADLRIQWIVPLRGNESVQGFNLNSRDYRRELFERARRDRRAYLSKPVQLIQGARGFITVHPIHDEQGFEGYIGGVFESREFLKSILDSAYPNRAFFTRISAPQSDVVLYEHPEWNTDSEHIIERPLDAFGKHWQMQIAPGQAMLDAHTSETPWLLLIGGWLLAVLLGTVTYLGLHARRQSRGLADMNRSLDHVVRARTGELRNVMMRLQKIREEERGSIARDLHDQLGQELTALKLKASAVLKNGLSKSPPKLKAWLLTAIDGLIDSAGSIAADLRPIDLRERSLPETIETSAENFEAMTGVRIIFTAMDDPQFPLEESRQVYRICQECLTNVARHAHAEHAYITLRLEDGRFYFSLEDDGRGFEPEYAWTSRSLGLIGMRERAVAIGGELHLESRPGGPTKVSLAVPLRIVEPVLLEIGA